ncbi:hypothetical protein [Fusobacterium sp.]|uniref:hypothetical protein n=1 Tax=Fusobacterium sp. TaxID=68766 RepID=UPI00396C9F59
MGFLSKQAELKMDTEYCEILTGADRVKLNNAISKRIRDGRVIKDVSITASGNGLVVLILYDVEKEKKIKNFLEK